MAEEIEGKILLSQSEWAKTHGFSRQHAHKLVKDGIIPTIEGLIDKEQADLALEQSRKPHLPERRGQKTKSDLSEAYEKLRFNNEMLKYQRNLLDEKLYSGLYVEKKKIIDDFRRVSSLFYERIITIPSRISATIAAKSDQKEIHKLICKEIELAFEELHRERSE